LALAALREPALPRPLAVDWHHRLLRPAPPRLHEGCAAPIGEAVRAVGHGGLCGEPAHRAHLLHLATAAVRDQPRDVAEGVVPAGGGCQRDAVRDLVQRPADGTRARRGHAAFGKSRRGGLADFLVRRAVFRPDASLPRSESSVGRVEYRAHPEEVYFYDA